MPRARKSLDQKLADLGKRQEQLEARRQTLMASKKSADRKIDMRRKFIVGAAVLTHAELNSNFYAMLRDILSAAVQRASDRRAIADLLAQPPATSQSAPNPQQIEP